MASWTYLPAFLVWAWVAGGIYATSSCGNCEVNGDSQVCGHTAKGEEYQIEVLSQGDVLQLRCESSTRALNFSSMENCSFPLVEQIQVYGCPLPNASFGEMVLQFGVYPENVTTLGFFDRNERDLQLEDWHLDGIFNLATLEFVNNDFGTLPSDLFVPTPNLKTLKVVSDIFSTLPESLFFNTLDLEALEFRGTKLKNLPEFLFANLSALINVSLSQNYIDDIQPDLFQDNVNIEYLDLSHNNISYFERDVFREMRALKNLSLQGNLLGSLPDGAFIDLESLKMLNLSSNILETLPEKIFDKIRKVEEINLSHNNLIEVPDEIFMACRFLERLLLNHNNLSKLEARMFPKPTNLAYLNLGHNNLSFAIKSSKILQEPQFVTYEDSFPLSGQTELQELLLNDNRIDFIPNAFSRLFVNLVRVDLSGNKIQYVSFQNLHFLNKAVELDLRNNDIKLMDFHEIYLMSEKEVKLFLGGNDLICDCRVYIFARIVQGLPVPMIGNTFKMVVEDLNQVTCLNHQNHLLQSLPEVDTKRLVCVVPDESCTKNCSCMWRPDDKMFIVNCSFKGMTELPDFSRLPANISVTLNMKNNSVTSLKGLQDPQYTHIVNMTLANNKISLFNGSDIPETLKILDIRGNNLTSLPDSLLEFLNATDTTLSFGGNPWICDCDLINFLNFLRVPLRKVTDFEDIRCEDGSDSLLDLTEYSICPFFMQPMVIVTLVAIGSFLLLFAVLGTVSFYKYKQGIKVWLYAHHMCLWAITEDEMDADKKFDAFISYSHKDEEFVNTVLVPGLESGDPKYRICLHYRDWVPGEYIQNQILQSVEASRRTIVVLSSNFIESVWGQLEFKAAHSQALQDRTNRIIVIVYGEIPPASELDEKLKLYIATKTYVKWGDAKFWEKLRYIMPHPPKKLN